LCKTQKKSQAIPPAQPQIDIEAKALGVQTLRRLWRRVTGSRQRETRTPTVNDRAFRQYLRHYDRQVTQLGEQLASGAIDVTEWLQRMESEIASLHLTADAIGRGGLSNMTVEDLNRVNRQVADQNTYLQRWARQLQDADEQEINPSAMRRRALMYAENANATLGQATVSAMGMPELPAQPKDGTTDCLTNCYCRWSIRDVDGDGNWDCYWIIDRSRDNCPQCVARAAAWSPLRIRGGVFVGDISSPRFYS
jgi:hypothetical protein